MFKAMGIHAFSIRGNQEKLGTRARSENGLLSQSGRIIICLILKGTMALSFFAFECSVKRYPTYLTYLSAYSGTSPTSLRYILT